MEVRTGCPLMAKDSTPDLEYWRTELNLYITNHCGKGNEPHPLHNTTGPVTRTRRLGCATCVRYCTKQSDKTVDDVEINTIK